jgi:hypothetical protein
MKKICILFLLFPLFQLGCSKSPAEKETAPSNSPSPTEKALPFEVTIVKSYESLEFEDVSNQVNTLLEGKVYDQLEALATDHGAGVE